MMDSGVVVIRTKHEKYDIIGFVAKVTDSYILLENPHFAIMSKESFNVSPYCPIADSLQFQFFLDDIIFCSPVIPEVEKTFILDTVKKTFPDISTSLH